MKNEAKRSSFAPLAVLGGLWFINILIVIFGSPFLIYKKIKDLFVKPVKIAPAQTGPNSEKPAYFSPSIDSKL